MFNLLFQNNSILLTDIILPSTNRTALLHTQNDLFSLNFKAIFLFIWNKLDKILFSPDIHRLVRDILTLCVSWLVLKLLNGILDSFKICTSIYFYYLIWRIKRRRDNNTYIRWFDLKMHVFYILFLNFNWHFRDYNMHASDCFSQLI